MVLSKVFKGNPNIKRISTHKKDMQPLWMKLKYGEHSQPAFPAK